MSITEYIIDYAMNQVASGDHRAFAKELKIPFRTVQKYYATMDEDDEQTLYEASLAMYTRRPDALKDALHHYDECADTGNLCKHAPAVNASKRAFLMNMRRAAADNKVDTLGFHGIKLIEAMEAALCGVNEDHTCSCMLFEAGGADDCSPMDSECPCVSLVALADSLANPACPCYRAAE